MAFPQDKKPADFSTGRFVFDVALLLDARARSSGPDVEATASAGLGAGGEHGALCTVSEAGRQ
jgi:hypothetical protein